MAGLPSSLSVLSAFASIVDHKQLVHIGDCFQNPQARSLSIEEKDERHPMNKAQVILQQSHEDELIKDGQVGELGASLVSTLLLGCGSNSH